MAEPNLVVDHLKKVFDTDRGDVEAVGDLDFTLVHGEFVCIVGPSGSGKTTLLKCIAGLLAPTRGRVLLEGRPITRPPQGMAVVFQEYGRSLFPWLTVEANVELAMKPERVARPQRRARAAEALAAVGLADVGRRYPWQLSGGMQQRVAIARAIVTRPSVLLMDEPFAAVDAQTRAELEDLILQVWREYAMTVLFVTHDIDESVYLGQRVLVLSLSPTHVLEDLGVDLPADRDQVGTRSLPRFAELRTHVYEQIQSAKRGARALS